MEWIYRIAIGLADLLLPLVALFIPKINTFYQGRKQLFPKLKEFRKANSGPLIWFHVASLGEYEQAKPVIQELKSRKQDIKIVVSFFSPSGYIPSSKKPQPGVDFITYLPLDTLANAQRFIDLIQPEQAYFVKYDLWYHFLKVAKEREISLYLIAASFRPEQVYFRRGGFFRKVLYFFDHIFTQNLQSIELLNSIGIDSVSLTGDTRFDRVNDTAQSPKEFPEIAHWKKEMPVVVLGSVWQEDMDLLIPLINSTRGYKWIVAPHDLSPAPMHSWENSLEVKSIFYSKWDQSEDSDLLFIDNIGMLSSLYQFAKVAYVGGAFGKGLHNILEAIGFGIPVIFGKVRRVSKFPEAVESVEMGCGFEVGTFEELNSIFGMLEQEENYLLAKNAAENWVQSNLGAAKKIVDFTVN
ncbi:glycosyltransferase N-terminal domain-containing protein [Algoriphagus sp. CAU 1675]|uniref:3-deoxy-D-manno-octulosonic acid transferase n=1 Tax=Algoriphagus sp. CAU 1675 TaxID=3032597 RepID=UPI0023DA112D|nr:glycosyltransferase N-terminal domain-containing protein [Algoriphagus sp. CAU 1675]MDF2156924.1 glycosyltransferase N-terminal domain-containing protein [Algoriphagus sp. CAU 1675]